ncbi:MAG: hypothetical protein M1839_003299 [Geoglossum umbratile]|nr:MAG: hypothetical protein M1839_003299 [Geoglossum umbratile]
MGCTGLPSCEGILDLVSDTEVARRIYFIGRIIENISLFAGLIYRATTDAQIDTSNILPAATETFFWQPDPRNERLCRYVGQATKDIISFSIVMSVTLFPSILIPATSAAVVQQTLPWARVAAGNALRNPWIANSLMMFPGTYIGPGVDKGCSRFLPVAADQRFERLAQLGIGLRNVQMEYRNVISTSIFDITRGAGFGENGTIADGNTVFADIVARGSFFLSNSEARDKFVNRPFGLEELYAQTVVNGIISTCLSASQCYLSCTEGETEQFGAKDSPLAKSRFCPKPDVACQAQCWRPSIRAKNVQVYGMDQLENSLWNVRIEDMLTQSYRNYAERTNPTISLPNITEFLANPQDSPQIRAAGFDMRVCQSCRPQTGDFTKHGRMNKLFPCTCGDVYSSETADFLAAAGFSTQSHKKELLRRCPKQLDKMVGLPVEHYLALCGLSVRWPTVWESRSIKPGADYSCGKVRREVNDRVAEGQSWIAINRWFCTESPEGLTIRREERRWVSTPRLYGHDDKCKKFLTNISGNPPRD